MLYVIIRHVFNCAELCWVHSWYITGGNFIFNQIKSLHLSRVLTLSLHLSVQNSAEFF